MQHLSVSRAPVKPSGMVRQYPSMTTGSNRSIHDGLRHDVYHRGEGRCVLITPEIPGITPTVTAFADRLVNAGFSVAIASLFGTPGRPSSTRTGGAILKACVSKEFHVLATRDSSPVTDWLRALARELHERHGGPGIGFVGMCLTGGFGLAMLLDDTVSQGC